MRALAVTGIFALSLVAGCLTGDETILENPLEGLSLPVGELPPGCGLDRAASVHGLVGQDVQVTGAQGVGCLVSSPWGGYEPSIGVDADGTLYLYPAWLREPVDDGIGSRLLGMGLARSTDGGATWDRMLSEIGPVNWQFFTADPFMYVDPATGRVFIEDLAVPPFNCSNLSFSDDKGETWTQTLGGCLEWDHVTFGAGIPVTSTPTGYANVVYRCAIALGATTVASQASGCQRSLDGGMTWGVTTYPYLGGPDGMPYAPGTCNGAHGHVKVDHRGWVWLPRGWCNDPYVAVSKDEGQTWTQHKISDMTLDSGHDAGIAVDPNGVAYYFWFGDGNQPLLSISRDDGQTWSEPLRIAPPGFIQGAMPSLISGGAGKLGFSYVGNFEFDGGEGLHGVVGTAYGVDGDAPVFQSAFVNPADEPLAMDSTCGGQACSGQGDFLTLAMGPDGAPWGAFMSNDWLSAGRIHGAPNLFDAEDAMGPFDGAGHDAHPRNAGETR